MIDGSVLQSAQRCFEKKSRVVVKMVVTKSQAIMVFIALPLKEIVRAQFYFIKEILRN